MRAATTASPTLRRVLRGSALGMGLLVSVGVVAPPASASPAPGFDGQLVPGAPGFMPLIPVVPSPPAGIVTPGESDSGAPTGSAESQPLTPDFGVGKNLDVHLTASSIPADLDLSGARFDVVDANGKSQASCTTDVHGDCPIPIAQGMPGMPGMPWEPFVAPGSYVLRQDPAHVVTGLAPSRAIPFTVCDPFAFMSVSSCQFTVTGDVVDTSLFRTDLAVTVRDGGTHVPLAGASFSLTSADYRHLDPTLRQDQVTTFPQAPGNQSPATGSSAAESSEGSAATASAPDLSAADPSADPSAVSTAATGTGAQVSAAATQGSPASGSTAGPVVSGPDGLLTYHGWFLADGLTLTPEVVPSGYRSSGVLPVAAPAGSGAAWTDTVDLAADEVGVPVPVGAGPALPPVAPRAPLPAPAPTPHPVASAPAAQVPPAASAPAGQVSPNASPAAGTAPVGAPVAPAAPTPAAGPAPTDPSGAPIRAAAPAAGDPHLRVAAATSLLDVGLIGFAVLFVALIVFGVGLMRRRARG